MDGKYSSPEVSVLDYPCKPMVFGDSSRKNLQMRLSFQIGKLCRNEGNLPVENEGEKNCDSRNSSFKTFYGLKQCQPMHSSPKKIHANDCTRKDTLDEGHIMPNALDISLDKMHDTKLHELNNRHFESSFTEIERKEKPVPSLHFYHSFLSNTLLKALLTILMVGSGMETPKKSKKKPAPKVVLTSPDGMEEVLKITSPKKLQQPPKSPSSILRRIADFPKIPKKQFTVPEKSPPQPVPFNRQASQSSTDTTITNVSEEEIPCGGFRLPSPSRRFRPPRDPFAIPEKFETVPSSYLPFDLNALSIGPQKYVFPSLIYDPDPAANKPPENNRVTYGRYDLHSCQPDLTKAELDYHSRINTQKDNPEVKKYVFPSLIYGTDPTTNKPPENSKTRGRSDQPGFTLAPEAYVDYDNRVKFRQQTPELGSDNRSSLPQNDTNVPKSLFNPKGIHFPFYSWGTLEVPIAKGGWKDGHQLAQNYRLNQSDPLQSSCQEAMKKFEEVFDYYISYMEVRMNQNLSSMVKFIDQTRRIMVRFIDSGAIVSNTYTPYEVRTSLANINITIDNLRKTILKIGPLSKYCFWMYQNLKYRPLTDYNKRPTRLDEIELLKTRTREFGNLLTYASKLINSYEPSKQCVMNFFNSK